MGSGSRLSAPRSGRGSAVLAGTVGGSTGAGSCASEVVVAREGRDGEGWEGDEGEAEASKVTGGRMSTVSVGELAPKRSATTMANVITEAAPTAQFAIPLRRAAAPAAGRRSDTTGPGAPD